MNAQDVKDVLDVQSIVASEANIVPEPELLAALIDWKRGNSTVTLSPTPAKTTAAKGKSADDEAF